MSLRGIERPRPLPGVFERTGLSASLSARHKYDESHVGQAEEKYGDEVQHGQHLTIGTALGLSLRAPWRTGTRCQPLPIRQLPVLGYAISCASGARPLEDEEGYDNPRADDCQEKHQD